MALTSLPPPTPPPPPSVFPAGTYLISDTIVINRTLGVAWMGTGRTTILKWAGGPGPTNPANNVSVMVWSDGNTRHYMEGFTFDAGNGCAVGLDHANKQGSQYESFNTHRNMRFTGFSVAGVRFGHGMPPHGNDIASAEQQFTNCIFDSNNAAVSFLAWNSYDNYFSGCAFQDNAYGLHCIACNYYLTNSRFQNSTVSDLLLPSHSSSVRRVVSVGSAAFIRQTDNNAFSAVLKVSEALVTGWGSAQAPSGALMYQTRGPVTLIDTVFEAPAHPASPVFQLYRSSCAACPMGVGGSGGQWESIVLINATTRGPCGPMLDPASTGNLTHLYTDFPPGDPAIAAALPPLSPSTQFFHPAWDVPHGRVFDAVRDFGAGNNQESAAPLQACMDAAAAAGSDAVCYVPAGKYFVNTSLRACGSGWSLVGGSSGLYCSIAWTRNASIPGAPAIITGPGAGCAASNLSISRVSFAGGDGIDGVVARNALVPANYCDQLAHRPGSGCRNHTVALPGGGAPSQRISVRMESVWFSTLVVTGLTSGDFLGGAYWNAGLEVWDSEGGVILPGFLGVSGAGLAVARSLPAPSPALRAGGLTGVCAAVSSDGPFDYRLYNSTGIVLGSYYTETGQSALYWEGRPGDPQGVIAIDAAKLNTQGGAAYPAWVINGSTGLLFHMGHQGCAGTVNVIKGGPLPPGSTPQHLDVLLLGAEFDDNATVWGLSGDVTLHALGNIVAPYEMPAPPPAPPETYPHQAFMPDQGAPNTKALVQQALDQLRRLGQMDLAFNLPWTSF